MDWSPACKGLEGFVSSLIISVYLCVVMTVSFEGKSLALYFLALCVSLRGD